MADLISNTLIPDAKIEALPAQGEPPISTKPATEMTSRITPDWAVMNTQLTPIGEWMPWAVWNPLKWWELPDKAPDTWIVGNIWTDTWIETPVKSVPWALEIPTPQITEEQKKVQDQADTAKKAAEDAAKKAQEMYDSQQAELRKNQAEYESAVAQNSKAALDALAQEKELARQQSEAAIAQQEQENKMAVYNAEVTNRTAAIQAEININKLWLVGSASAINQVQAIAKDWAVRIADIQVKGANLLAQNKIKAAEIQLEFVKAMNEVTSDATDKIQKTRFDTLWKIIDVQDNIITSEKDKNATINEIITKAKETQRQIEADLSNRTIQISQENDRRVEAYYRIIEQAQTQADKKFSWYVESGAYAKLPESQKALIAKEKGVSIKDLDAEFNSKVSWGILTYLNAQYSSDGKTSNLNLPPETLSKINWIALQYINNWMGTAMAIKAATDLVLKDNKEAKDILELKDGWSKLALNQAKAYEAQNNALLREQKTLTEKEITKIKAADANTEEALRNSQIAKNNATATKARSVASKAKWTSAWWWFTYTWIVVMWEDLPQSVKDSIPWFDPNKAYYESKDKKGVKNYKENAPVVEDTTVSWWIKSTTTTKWGITTKSTSAPATTKKKSYSFK